MTRLLVIFLLFGLPFLVLPLGPSNFETPKVIAGEIAIELLVAYTLIKQTTFPRLRPLFLIGLGVIFLLSIFDLIFLRTTTTFFGNPFRLQGVFLLWHLLLFSLVAPLYTLSQWLRKLTIFPLLALALTVVLFGYNPAGRAVGSLGEPNFLAATAVFFWPFLLSSKKSLLIPGFILALAIFFVSASRSGIIALAIQVIFIFMTQALKIKLSVSVLFCLGLLVLSLFLPLTLPKKIYEDRAEIWQTAILASLDRPITGYGFGNTEEILKKESIALSNNIHFQYVDSAHNILLDLFLAGGLVGLLAFFLLLFSAFRTATQQNNLLILTILLGLLTVLSFNPGGVTTLIALYWVLGQGACTIKKRPSLTAL